MTNCELHNGKIKLGGYKGGRGYCGYYTTHFGKKIYLRSTQEFVYAKYLDSIGVYYLTENIIYEIDGKNYKPDFFIYDGMFDKLDKIVEIKYTNGEKAEYQKMYSIFFENIGIKYEVISRCDIKDFIRMGIVTKDDINQWKKTFISQYEKFDYSGEKNPMYGIKHSVETKKKIGKQTRKYFQDPVVRKRHRDARVSYWASSVGNITKKKYAELRTKESMIKNPTIKQVCVECGREYERQQKGRYHKETCSNSCQQRYNWKIGKNKYRGGASKSYKSKIKKYFKVLLDKGHCITIGNYDDIVQYQKSLGTIPKHFGMNLCIVKKYFGSLTNLKKEMNYKYE